VPLRFEVLGSAGAAPLQGACSAYIVSSDDTTVLLDCGPGALERLWRRGVLGRLDAIVLSHMHADHILDLVMLAGELGSSLLAAEPPPLYVPREDGRTVLADLDAALATPGGRHGAGRSRFDEAFTIHDYGADTQLTIGAVTFEFAPTSHSRPCYACRAGDGRTSVVYGADGGPSQQVAKLASGAGLLVLEATYVDDELAAQTFGHMTAGQAGALAQRAKVSRLLLTHTIAGTAERELIEGATAAFSGPVELAHEGYALEL
jgi:ribonuclease BN (tRNA processing enzyme)